MLDVLLAGARPGQRHPGAADTANILAAAARARVSRTASNLTDPRWADAAAIAGLLAAIAMLSIRLRHVAHTVALDLANVAGPQILGYAYLRPAAAWAVVVLAALTRLRRTAAVLGWLALAYDAAPLVLHAGFAPDVAIGTIWTLAVGLLAAGALSVPARGGRPLLGWRRLIIIGLACAGGVLTSAFNTATTQAGITRPLWGIRPAELTVVGFAAAAILLAVAVGTLPPGVRRRTIALFAPAGSLLLLAHSLFSVYLIPFGSIGTTLARTPVEWLVVLTTPVLAFAVAVTAVHWREQRQRLLDLGRRADRPDVSPTTRAG